MNKRAFAYYLLIMFVFPVLSLAHGLRSNLGMKFKRKLLIVFITIYGSVITISESNDGFRHQERVYSHYVDLSFVDFFSEIFDILFFRGNPNINDDLYIHIISYLTGGVLGMPWLFFIVVSFVYAYFFSGSLFKVINLRKGVKYKWYVYGFVVIFILWKNIEGINTVRTWTGLWVLFYACISYYTTKKKKYLLLMFTPPLIHVGYFIMAIPAWLVLILGVRHKMFIILLILSFSTTILNPQIVLSQLEKTETGQNKIRGYYVEEERTSSELIEEYAQNTWYKRFYALGVQNLGVNLLAFVVIGLGVYRLNLNTLEAHLFSIGILTKALSNVTWFLTAVSNRSGLISGLFILACIVLFLLRNNSTDLQSKRLKLFNNLIKIGVLIFVPFFIYKIADMIYFISVYMLAFPFISWFADNTNYSIREFLGLFI